MNDAEKEEGGLSQDPEALADYDPEAETISSDGQIGSGKQAPEAGAIPSGAGIVTEKVGSIVGPYKLLKQIGEGGFGVVYLAEQSKPIRRQVAFKIIKPGMDTKEVIARFEVERQAVALMDHPNIAKVFDAGATDTGRPYFAMELVDGVPVTSYCDRHRLGTRERLILFQDICGAVQHAHQKGIIHRDLKPSNILVSHLDTNPVIKIIDFGIAKAVSQDLTENTLYTALGQMIGTPQYMSPEQAGGGGVDIDTRSDIYALGVILYELLTGRTPFELRQLRKIGYEEILRIIQEEDPPRPSTRLGALTEEDVSTIAEAHRVAPDKLTRLVKGDLDWITMKALEKERDRRYETATAFGEDIRRYLENDAVEACPPTASYRMRKFARRNRLALSVAAVMSATLLAATVISTWQAIRATRAETRAEAERKLANQANEDSRAVRGFFENNVLAAARPRNLYGGLGIHTTIKEAIDAAEPKIENEFADRPIVEASIRGSLSDTYFYLGELDAAIQQGELASALLSAGMGPKAPDTLRSLLTLANYYRQVGRSNEAEALAKQSVDSATDVLNSIDQYTLRSLQLLANSYGESGYYEEALALHEKVFQLRREELGLEDSRTIESMSDLAISYNYTGHHKQALALKEEVLRIIKVTEGPEHSSTLLRMNSLAVSYWHANRRDEAIAMTEEAVEISERVHGREHPDTLNAMGNLALYYGAEGRTGEALSMKKEILELREKVLGPEHPGTIRSIQSLAVGYAAEKHHEEALGLFQKSVKLKRKVLGPEHPDTLEGMSALAIAYLKLNRLKDAEELYLELISLQEKRPSGEAQATIRALIKIYRELKAPEQVAEWQAKLKTIESAESDDSKK